MKNKRLRDRLLKGMAPKKMTSYTKEESSRILSLVKIRNTIDLNNDNPLIRMKQCIIHLRRGVHTAKALKIFKQEIKNIDIDNLDSRWLISILETIVDHGSEIDKRNAMLVSSFMAHERTFQRPDTDKEMPLLWDGMKYPRSSREDYHKKWSRRLKELLSKSPLIHDVFVELVVRSSEDPRFSLNRANKKCKYDLIQEFLDEIK